MSPSEIATLKIFLSEKYMEFVTFNQIFSIFFLFGGFAPDPIGGSVNSVNVESAGDGTHSFVLSETNSWLRPFTSSPMTMRITLKIAIT